MLQNAYFLAKNGADTTENEQHFAEILPKTGNYPAPTSKTRCPHPTSGSRCPHPRRPAMGMVHVSSGRDGGFGRYAAPAAIPDGMIPRAVFILVERFDIEAYSDFSAKCLKCIGLVLFCINAKFCMKIIQNIRWKALGEIYKICIFCTAAISKFSQKNRFEKTAIFVKFQQKKLQMSQNLPNFKNFSLRIW